MMFGACKLCACSFMGSADNECSCKHCSYDHVLLSECTEEGCECRQFNSIHRIQDCYDCGHLASSHEDQDNVAGNVEFETLKSWRLKNMSVAKMAQCYGERFGQHISKRTMERKLREYDLRQSQNALVTDDDIVQAVQQENEAGVVGYQTLHTVLRQKHGMFVSRDRVRKVIRENGLPSGPDPKLRKKYHSKPFISKGPNWLWASDGYEKLAQPYGLYIYGIIDTFSRKMLSLKVLPNKRAGTICDWVLDHLESAAGMPKSFMTDKGREWARLKEKMPIISMRSVFNQKIEAFWNQLGQHSDIKWYRGLFRDLEEMGDLDPSDETDRHCLWLATHDLIQRSLNEFRETHNSHRIRKQSGVELPTGYSPNDMYGDCSLFPDVENYLQPVTVDTRDTHHEAHEVGLPDNILSEIQTVKKETAVRVYNLVRDHIKQQA